MPKTPRKRAAINRLTASRPGLLGLALIAGRLGMVAYAKAYPPHAINLRIVALLVACGVVAFAYWAFANDDGSYNF